jgi:hypothetical protein
VKDEKIVSPDLFMVFQADYASTRRSVIAPLLGQACEEERGQEFARFMSIIRLENRWRAFWWLDNNMAGRAC